MREKLADKLAKTKSNGRITKITRQMAEAEPGRYFVDHMGMYREKPDWKPPLPSLEQLRMTFNYKKKNSTPALLSGNTTLINYGELFVIVGLPGQGKTAICESNIVAQHTRKQYFGFTFNSRGGKALLADTERHPDDVSDSYNNIAKRIGNPQLDKDGEIKDLVCLSLAEHASAEELKGILERELSTGEYELVILDGILDFCLSMNDDKDATDVVKWARMLAVKHNIALILTLHPNKGTETLAGHLGAFLYRWARAILFVRSVKNDKSVKELTAEPDMAKLSHGDAASFQPVYFTWDPNYQLLMPCDYTPQQDRGKADKIKNALEVVLADGKRYRYGELVEQLVKLGHAKGTAKRWITSATEDELLNTTGGIYSLKI